MKRLLFLGVPRGGSFVHGRLSLRAVNTRFQESVRRNHFDAAAVRLPSRRRRRIQHQQCFPSRATAAQPPATSSLLESPRFLYLIGFVRMEHNERRTLSLPLLRRWLSSSSSSQRGGGGGRSSSHHLRVEGYLERFLRSSTSSSSSLGWEDLAAPARLLSGYLSGGANNNDDDSTLMLAHLHWMVQKDRLRQDMLLVGPCADTPLRRRLALAFAELMNRNVQVLTITGDLTESDLKQRRELRRSWPSAESEAASLDPSTMSTQLPPLHLLYENASPVDAALEGDVLLLDGIERASRNVLPTLNNLIEHRTMNLEDGRVLVPPRSAVETLTGNEESLSGRFVPVHPNFRVLATAVPPGLEGGRALDPPLRSRFQIRRVNRPPLVMVGSNSDESDEDDRIRSAVRFLAALDLMGRSAGAETTIGRLDDGAATPHRPWPVHQLASTLRLIRDFPAQDPKVFLERFYYYTAPFPSQSDRRASADDRGRRMLDTAGKPPKMSVFDRLWNEIVRPRDGRSISPRPLGSFASRHPYRIEQIVRDPDNPSQSQVIFVSRSGGDDAEAHQSEHHSVTLTVPSGPLPKGCGTDSSSQPWQSRYWCLTQGLEHTVTSMVQSHGAGHDLLLLSPSGEGKSSAAAYFCSLLGYRRNLVHAHPEMSFQDLFLRRVTTSHGETRWEESTLLSSIREGSVCVLDHAHKLRPDVLAGLQSLCLDRDVWLPDGRRIAPSSHRSLKDNNGCEDRNGGTIETAFNEPSKIVRAHPSFRLIALASTEGNMSWLTQDVQGMLSVIALPPPTADCHRTILHRFASKEDHDDDCPTALVDKLLHVHSSLTTSVAEDCGVQPLSTRNMIRVAKQLSVTSTVSDLHCSIWNVLLADLLPPSQKDTLNAVLRQVGVTGNADALARPTDPPVAVVVNDKTCRIGNLSITRFCARQPERVPAPKFFDIPSHVRVLRELLRSWSRGERAFLLMGNQGVGKNVIVDRLCQLVNYEREYLQLHRDSTIGQLTLQPTLDGGRIVWNDSPLVRAASEGLVLVVDEADKAPTEVVAILKGLVEDGELMLGDGRRISRHESGHGIISMHPNFTLFVLANRPGYPFLGNPFFKQIGDCFETRVVANPDLDSEVRLLQSYGPSLDYSLVKKIASSFSDLRSLVEHGVLTYPYSTREAIAVVKHLEMYPDDSVVRALHNVIDYDTFDPLVYGTLGEVFKRNGVPVESFEAWEEAIRLQGAQLKKDKWVEQIMHERDSSSRMPPPLSFPKEGKWDDKNEPHVGGNQWAGGTGGSDTAGLGGRGGPYRLDRGHKVHQVSDEAKAQVSDEAAAATRAIARQALQEKLNEIDMSEMEWNMYHRFVDSIQQEIQNLRAILNQADVKHSEERWLTRQSHGELDEMRLVEGVTGARNIYKRRSTQSDSVGIFLRPKVFHFVVDVSGSMYRFNGHDGRLTRCLEATSLVMESLNGFERLFEYRIVGHSGDSSSIRFVDDGRPPSNEKRRLQILQQMIAHSQYCQPGDNTLEAIAEAIQEASKDDEARDGGGGAIVVAISDANLERYGIHPRALGRVIESGNDRNVSAHCIFIASFGDEAEAIRRELPVGRGHVCYRTADLPKIVKNIIATQV